MTSKQFNKMQLFDYYNRMEDKHFNLRTLRGENHLLSLLPEPEIQLITLWMKEDRQLQAPRHLLI